MATANVGGKQVVVNAPGVTQWATPASSPTQFAPTSTPPAMAESIARASGGTTLPNPTGVTPEQFANPVPQVNPVQNPQTPPPINTAQPNPATVNATPFSGGPTPGDIPQALAAAQASGPAPQENPRAAIDAAIKSTANPNGTYLDSFGNTLSTSAGQTTKTSTPNVDNFFNPQVNPNLQDTIKQLTDFLNPATTTKTLDDQLAIIKTDQATVAGLNTKLMNIDTIMKGTVDDIGNEIMKANGFATTSQVLALSIARNKTLQLQASEIQNQLTTAQNQVQNDTTLFQNEKDMANTQFSQRMGIYQAAETIQQNQLNATKDAANSIIKNVGYSGFVNSLLNTDPTGQSLAHNEQLLGLAPGQLKNIATQEQSANNLAVIQASGTTSPYVVTSNGEVWNTQTGYAYTSLQDFQQKTGKTLQSANIQKLPANIEQQTKLAQMQKAQTDAQFAPALNQANLNQSNASAASSAASAANSRADLAFKQAHNGLTPAEVNTQQTAIETATQKINSDASGYIEKLAGKKMSWNDAFNAMKAQHPDLSIQAIDNLLQSNNYRP